MSPRRIVWALLVALSSLAARAFAAPLATQVRCIGMLVSDLEVLQFRLSPHPVESSGSSGERVRALLVRDPDGHPLLLSDEPKIAEAGR